MRKFASSRNFFLFAIAALTTLFLLQACRKMDAVREKNENIIVLKFFNDHTPTDLKVKAAIGYIKRKHEKYQFAENVVEKIGFPYWDKTRVFENVRTGKSKPTGNNNRETTMSQSPGSDTADVLYIPFVRPGENRVNTILMLKMTGTDTVHQFLSDWQYKQFGFGAEQSGQWNAGNIFHIFMTMNNTVFGHTQFIVTDQRLLSDTSKNLVTLEPAEETSTNSGDGQTQVQSYYYGIQFCHSVKACVYVGNTSSGRLQTLNSPPYAGGVCVTSQSCTTIWVLVFTNDDAGGDPNGSGPPNTDPNNGGNPSGGSNPDPNDPPDDWEPEECNTDPQAPQDPFSEPCEPGWTPTGGGNNPPSYTPLNNANYEKDANFHNISTYVTSSGKAITLPPGSKIKTYKNIDLNIFPNGALYAFVLPSGDTYVAVQQQYLAASALAVPPPHYTGFYKVNPDNTVDFNSPYPETAFQYPQPVNGAIKAVRIKEIKKSDGTCHMVRELVDYAPGNSTPATASENADVNYGIEFLDAQITSSTPAEETPLQECSGASPSTYVPYTLQSLYNEQSQYLTFFLNSRIQSSVKVYLYDCNTNETKYTITKNGASPASGSMTEYDNNSFSEDIAIKACLENGQWKYDVKYNPAGLSSGNVHPKVQQHLSQVVAEIKRQADEEARFLKNPKKRYSSETINVADGERFFKEGMNLFESLAAIYDVGKHIISEGQMPEYIWDQGRRSGTTLADVNTKYFKSPFNLPSGIAGGADQLIDEVTGVVQLVKMGLEAIRRPRATFNNIYESIRTLNEEKLKQILSSISGLDNYLAGGDRAIYQGGRHSVQAAMIFFSSIKALADGTKAVKEAGDEITDLQKFLPDATPNSQVSDALKNAAENNKLLKNIDNEKLLTENVINGQRRTIAIDKDGEIYDASAINNLDEIGEDVMKKADAGDIAESAEDIVVHNEMKTQSQRFKDGKDFERNINNDASHPGKVQAASGIDLTGFNKAEQVQINLPNGKYMVADNVWWKEVNINGQQKFEIVVNESKLSDAAPFSINQVEFKNQILSGTTNFTLRNTKFNPDFPQNAQLVVKSYVNTVSNGTTGTSNYNVIKIF
ncbi:MAG: hypothetical protein JNN00_11680 [Chitinophagaceae bacterium]|nr:hypothetical protein [Chitinophagaceae bacterium]